MTRAHHPQRMHTSSHGHSAHERRGRLALNSSLGALLGGVFLLAGLASCASRGKAKITDAATIESLIDHGQYEEAVVQAAALHEEQPNSAPAELAHRRATLAFLLDHARHVSFDGDNAAALVEFDAILAQFPNSSQADAWVRKTRLALADDWFRRGTAYHSEDQLDAALEAYDKALVHDPDLMAASSGRAHVILQMNYRLGLSDTYYNEGVRALHDYWLRIALSRFRYVGKYRPGNARAERRSTEVEKLLAEDRIVVARGLENSAFYRAARNEFEIVKGLDPENQEAIDGAARMKIESEAARLYEAGDMNIKRGYFEKGIVDLNAGLALTTMQHERFNALIETVDDKRVARIYQSALDQEHDLRKEEAIATYNSILEERSFYLDVLTRVGSLRNEIALAERTYEAARNATSDKVRLDKLLEIDEFIWPDYLDIHEQIAILKAALAAQGKSDAEGSADEGAEDGADGDGN